MELKVRVDGLSRVVCGVSEKTTCQEVVIALAHAMGRTGRFTLIEKWRDSERPLLPTDYPVKVLHKWGEYASEVQLLLHQSDKKVTAQSENIPKQVNAQDKLLPISKSHVKEKEGGLRRVLTFSGSHNTVTPLIRQGGSARGRHRMTDQKPFDKIPEADSQIVNARTRRDPSPHVNGMGEGFHPAYRADRDRTTYRGYRDEMLEPTQHAFHIHSKEAKHVKLNQDDDHRAAPSGLHNNTGGRTTHFDRPYLSYGNFSQAGNTAQPTDFPTDHNHRLRGSNNVANISVVSNTNRHPPPHPATANRFTPKLEQRADVHSNQNDVFDPHLRKSPYNYKVPNAQTYVNESVRSHSPLVQNRNRNSAFQPVRSITPKEQNEIPFMNGDLDVPLYSGVPEPPTDLEEYDLDTNLPGVGHTSAKQLLIEEYRMPGDGRHREQDLSPTDNAAVEDPEVVRMRKLVALQQDRIKAQGNQITGIEQDIKQLEQEDREQTELLTKISDEIIDLTKANHKYEIEIKELDATKWVDVIESEKNQEKEARVSIEDIKTRLVRTTEEIQGLNSKAVELEKEISVEKSELEKDAEILKEKEREIEKEIQSVTEDLEKENQKIDDDKVALDDIERELKELSARMDQQKEEVEELEKELKDANIEEFNLSPKEARKAKKPDTGEAVLKMLEGRVSPAIGLTRKSVVSPLSKVLSASKNPNGVWV